MQPQPGLAKGAEGDYVLSERHIRWVDSNGELTAVDAPPPADAPHIGVCPPDVHAWASAGVDASTLNAIPRKGPEGPPPLHPVYGRLRPSLIVVRMPSATSSPRQWTWEEASGEIEARLKAHRHEGKADIPPAVFRLEACGHRFVRWSATGRLVPLGVPGCMRGGRLVGIPIMRAPTRSYFSTGEAQDVGSGAEGWRALQDRANSINPDGSGLDLVFRRVRIFSHSESEWFPARIALWNAGARLHVVDFDDGERKSMSLKEREVVVVGEYGEEVTGKRVALEMALPFIRGAEDARAATEGMPSGAIIGGNGAGAAGGSDGDVSSGVASESAVPQTDSLEYTRSWYTGRVTGYDADTELHLIRFDPRFDARVRMLTTKRSTGEGAGDLLDGDGSWEMAVYIHSHEHVWLCDVETLPLGSSLLGKRVQLLSTSAGKAGDSVQASEPLSLFMGTITQYIPPDAALFAAEAAAAGAALAAAAAAGGVASSHPTFAPALTAPTVTAQLLLGLGDAFANDIIELQSNYPAARASSPTSGRGSVTPKSSSSSRRQARASLEAAAPTLLSALQVAAHTAIDLDSVVKVVLDSGGTQSFVLRNLQFAVLQDTIRGTPPGPGAVGLLNLGNTCYLNAVLQALMHVRPLAGYAGRPAFLASLNTANKHGMGGRMAMAFALLVRTLWTQEHMAPSTGTNAQIDAGQGSELESVLDAFSAASPAFVKALLSERNSTFHGNGQQDAHEALMALLDAMHEDLAVRDETASAAAAADAAEAADEERKEKEKKEEDKETKEKEKAGMKTNKVAKTAGVPGLSFGFGMQRRGDKTPAGARSASGSRSNSRSVSPTHSSTPGPIPLPGVSDTANAGCLPPNDVPSSASSTRTSQADLQAPVGISTTDGWIPTTITVDTGTGALIRGPVSGITIPSTPGSDSGSSNNAGQWQPGSIATVTSVASFEALATPNVASLLRAPSAPSPSKFVETTSIVKQVFFMQTQLDFTCPKNGRHVDARFGPRGGEMLPPISLAGKVSQKHRIGLFFSKTTVRDPVLADCLDNYFRPSDGEGIVERKCDRCGRNQLMTQRPWLRSLPPVLVIQLKRFEYSAHRNENMKLNDAIAFPLRDLDLSKYVHPSVAHTVLATGFRAFTGGEGAKGGAYMSAAAAPWHALLHAPCNGKYDLFAAVCHVGDVERGHYTTYARATDEQTAWFLFDDTNVTPAREEDVTSERVMGMAYLLFYVRQTPESVAAHAAYKAQVLQQALAAAVAAGVATIAGKASTSPTEDKDREGSLNSAAAGRASVSSARADAYMALAISGGGTTLL